MQRPWRWLWLLLVGCSTRGAPSEARVHEVAAPRVSPPQVASAHPPPLRSAQAFVLKGGTVFGLGQQNLLIDGGHVVLVGAPDDAAGRVVDVSGRYIVPGFIDCHVHLAYFPEGAAELSSNGIVAAVDLAAPLKALSVEHAPLRVLNAGPMLTAANGYPLNSWGADGYGLVVNSALEGAAAVDTLFNAGARLVKVPLTAAPTLDDATVRAVVARAHARGLKVYSHALEEENAARAAADGVDVLAHTPTEALSEATLQAWQGRTVVTTLGAFGGGAAALKNLAALRQRGTRVL